MCVIIHYIGTVEHAFALSDDVMEPTGELVQLSTTTLIAYMGLIGSGTRVINRFSSALTA